MLGLFYDLGDELIDLDIAAFVHAKNLHIYKF